MFKSKVIVTASSAIKFLLVPAICFLSFHLSAACVHAQAKTKAVAEVEKAEVIEKKPVRRVQVKRVQAVSKAQTVEKSQAVKQSQPAKTQAVKKTSGATNSVKSKSKVVGTAGRNGAATKHHSGKQVTKDARPYTTREVTLVPPRIPPEKLYGKGYSNWEYCEMWHLYNNLYTQDDTHSYWIRVGTKEYSASITGAASNWAELMNKLNVNTNYATHLHVMDHLGARGWELVDTETRYSGYESSQLTVRTWTFKRPSWRNETLDK